MRVVLVGDFLRISLFRSRLGVRINLMVGLDK